MRKNYVYLVLLLLLNISMFGQKVMLTPTVVNGQNVSGGPLNLGGTPNSTVSLNVTVEMPSIPGNNGTITIHSVNGFSDNIVTGGNGGSLFFGEGKSASRSFVVNLLWSSFATSGSFIYAEYKTASNVAYKSSYLAVIKNATQTGGTTLNPPADAPNPSNIVNTLCCNQTIRQGDKPAPITGSQYLNPYQGLPYGVNSRWSAANATHISLDDANKILNIDYTSELKNLTITRELGYVYGGQFPNKSNDVTITVVPSPITSNEISVTDAPITDGFIEITNTNPKSIVGGRSNSIVNLNILQNSFHIAQRGDNIVNIERYEWEYTKTSLGLGGPRSWQTIAGQNSSTLDFFNPTDIENNEDNYYLVRRIAIYQNIKRASNSLKILLRTVRYNNNICCDQILNIPSAGTIESPSTIIGSIPFIDETTINGSNLTYTVAYQWQSQSITNNSIYGSWLDISGANSKDYLPLPLKFIANTRGSLIIQTTYNYRRIATINYQIIQNGQLVKGNTKSYSNESSLISSNSIYNSPTLTVYPNPASSIINIENKGTTYILANTQINIVNTMGVVVSSNNFSIINPNLVSINISSLIMGTYFINIQTEGNRNIQLTFIKNN